MVFPWGNVNHSVQAVLFKEMEKWKMQHKNSRQNWHKSPSSFLTGVSAQTKFDWSSAGGNFYWTTSACVVDKMESKS